MAIGSAMQQKIQVITEFLTKGFNRQRKELESLTRAQKELAAAGQKMQAKQFAARIQELKTNQVLRQRTGGQAKLINSTNKLGKSMDKGRLAAGRFNISLLGVMFFGMALQRMMFGLLSTSMKWAGVWDVLEAALGILFLPIALEVLDWALKFLNWVSSLSPETQKLIGWIVLFAGVLGTVLSVIGQIGLGVGALTPYFTKFFALFKSGGGLFKVFTTAAGGLSMSVLAIAAVILAVVAGIWLAFRENFLNIQTFGKMLVDSIKGYWQGLLSFFSGFWDIIKGIFSGNGDLILQGFMKVIEGMGIMLKNLGNMILSLMSIVIIGIARLFLGSLQATINTFIAAYDKIAKFFGGRGTDFRIDLLSGLSLKKESVNDFILSGNKLIKTNPQDTLYGVKNGPTKGTGEAVTFAPNITVNASINSDTDVRKLAEDLKTYWVNDFERLVQRRGV